MLKNIFTLIITLSISLNFIGCSSNGGGDSNLTFTVGTQQRGNFIDAPVQGLSFISTTHQGITAIDGEFTYRNSEEVEFFLGNLSLGKALGQKIITPYTLAGDTDLDNPSVLATNIAQILQSLDDTNLDPTHIVIPESLQSLDINNTDLTINSDAQLQTILTKANAITNKSYILIDEATANANMKAGVDAAQ